MRQNWYVTGMDYGIVYWMIRRISEREMTTIRRDGEFTMLSKSAEQPVSLKNSKLDGI